MFSCEYCKYFKNNLCWLLLFFPDHFRWFAGFWIPLCIKKFYVTYKVIVCSISGYSQAIIKHYLRVYSYIFRTFSIPGIFRNLVYSKVPWYLDPCQTYCSVFGRYFLPIIIFLFLNAPSKTIFNKGLYFDLSIRAT